MIPMLLMGQLIILATLKYIEELDAMGMVWSTSKSSIKESFNSQEKQIELN